MALKIRKLKLNEVASVDRKLMNVVRMVRETLIWFVTPLSDAGIVPPDRRH